MQFTYDAYRSLLALLKTQGYVFTNYHDHARHERCVILRHDIDYDLSASVRMAELEAQEGVRATYFVLLRTDFYNVASKEGRAALQRIHDLGHEIGLHFDELAYSDLEGEQVPRKIQEEVAILSHMTGLPITSISMHRPSQTTLTADYEFPLLVNSYSHTFFYGFKYLSDSRRRWREPVMEIVKAGTYDRLHILTHAFWYHDTEQSITQTVKDFVCSANHARYISLMDNITDLPSILQESEL